ncbi:MAG: gliding motility lipoprotein GldH [Alistipes sp.]|nr:gliding motility lipoprotein GldH [Alistipes sp.]
MRQMLSLPVLIISLAGCISTHTERVVDVDPYGWFPYDTLWVESPNRDTTSLRSLWVIARYNRDIRLDSIGISITTVTPDSLRFTERIRLDLTSTGVLKNGHYESIIPYRDSSRLSRPGTYRFGFAPTEMYRGVTAIGIKSD